MTDPVAAYGTCESCGAPRNARLVDEGDGNMRYEMYCTGAAIFNVSSGDIIVIRRGKWQGDVRVTKVTPCAGHSVTIETEPA